MSEPRHEESIVLCEGYHDRAFWSGWLLSLGCTDLKPVPGKPVLDPWNKPVRSGAFAFSKQSGSFVRVVPVHGVGSLLREGLDLLPLRTTRAIRRLILSIDSDDVADDAEQRTSRLKIKDVKAAIEREGIEAKLSSEGDVSLDGGATTVSLVRWEAADANKPGLPTKQTLERLVCACICAAYPERGTNVQEWLKSRHEPPAETVKEYAWSYYAGWLASHGTDHFYRSIWDDTRTRAELEKRLTESGAWRIAMALAK